MLINDNLAVVQALPERVGLHIGQEDTPIGLARKLLGPQRLIGLSVHSVEQAQKALLDRGMADYVGVGPVYGTTSKSGIQDDDVIGPRGAREIVEALASHDGKHRLPSVLIGGINQKTALRSLFGATSYNNRPDGVAVISAIVARQDADVAAAELGSILKRYKDAIGTSTQKASAFSAGLEKPRGESLVRDAAELLSAHRSNASGPPLIQTLTSHVSSTLSANVALAFSASPIMSHQEAEADDLGRVTGAVVLNIGTISEEARRGMRAVGAAANRGGKPVVLDPVGVGASSFRKGAVNEIMNHTQITLLKGNSAELSAIAGLTEVQSRGVDSGAGSLRDPEGLVRSLAIRERCLVLMTGKIDYLSDGRIVVKVHNGHELLGRITGSGCALGVTVAAGMAAACSISKAQNINASAELGSLMVSASGANLFRGALLG
jgi:thiamine-phosphate diphosphorylase/hydroxyethylthiazole kinase